MATFLCALRLAVNVERTIDQYRKTLFQLYGDSSVMFVPPVIPVAVAPRLPEFHRLDRFRKKHHLRIIEGSTVAAPVIRGFRELTEDFYSTFQPSTIDSPLIQLPQPKVQISFYHYKEFDNPPALPVTSALWLSVFEIEFGLGERWWSGGRWKLYFNRRLSNRPDPPR